LGLDKGGNKLVRLPALQMLKSAVEDTKINKKSTKKVFRSACKGVRFFLEALKGVP